MKKQDLNVLVREKLEKYGAVNLPLVLAVSGGPDSMVMLDIIRRLVFPINLTVVHVNHGLRKTALRDQRLVVEYCNKYQLSCVVRQADVVGSRAKNKGSVEEVARDLRYKILREEAKLVGAVYILVAHNANDQAETLMFNLARGAGLRGIGGMREWSEDILRPLLSVEKRDILDYAKKQKIMFAQDESNKSLEYTRNFIRKKVLPELGKINPNLIAQLYQTSMMVQSAEQATRDLARLHLVAMATGEKGSLTFSCSKMLELTEFMRAEVIKSATELLEITGLEWTSAMFKQIDGVIRSPEKMAEKRIGGKLLVGKRYDKISISRNL